jgi:lipoprotein-anchoring transpeptidase ErfK/SrfK
MIRVMQAALLVIAVSLLSGAAQAQYRGYGDSYDRYSRSAERARAERRHSSRRQASRNRSSSWWWDDDDDDDEDDRRASRQRRSSVAGNGAAVRQGGPRPSISPVAPATVRFSGYAPGSIVIDTGGRALYFVRSSGTAYRYAIAVGRQGFTWTGTQRVSRVAAWPDWHPPAEMRQRDPRLPVKMTGGLYNPLGAKAIYLGNTLYRIHGTNNARSIGSASSSGCFRMTNGNVMHLASMVQVGAQVHVMRRLPASVRSTIASTRGGDAS